MRKIFVIAILCVLAIALAITLYICASQEKMYTRAQLAQHNSHQTGIWVSYGEGVYDITSFVASHPGGQLILQAAGKDLSEFWNTFPIHKNPQVYKLLESFRIGSLSDPIVHTQKDEEKNTDTNFRHIIHTHEPLNAETRFDANDLSFITANESFYVRNHFSVPMIDADSFQLRIKHHNNVIAKYSLPEIKTNFRAQEIVATLQCAGNRRAEMNAVKTVNGLMWGAGAIGTAKWTGALLKDVLTDAGVSEHSGQHVHFTGLDNATGIHFEISLPLDYVLDPKKEVLLAYLMNGQHLPPEHGFPLRLIAPGLVGAKQVKWLASLTISDTPSDSQWQKKSYKTFSPGVTAENAPYDSTTELMELPVQSFIVSPKNDDHVALKDGFVEICGFAYSGGGREIKRVDISLDNAESWHEAELNKSITQSYGRSWAWTVWRKKISRTQLDKYGLENVQVISRAIDNANNVQPEAVRHIWNFRGLANNAWHRVRFSIR